MNSQEMKKEKKIWIVRSIGVIFALFLSIAFYLNESQFSWIKTNIIGLICTLIAFWLITYKLIPKRKKSNLNIV